MSLREVICDVLRRVVAWGGAGVVNPSPHVSAQFFAPMSLLLGETFSVFKVQGPVQWVLQTQNLLLFKYIELPKIFVLAPSF